MRSISPAQRRLKLQRRLRRLTVSVGVALAVVAGPMLASASPGEPEAPNPNCTVTNTSGCVAATTLSFTDKYWVCSAPISSYGQLPVRVVLNFTKNYVPPQGSGVVQLSNGCTGDSNSTSIDLMLDVRGNGKTQGAGDDAIRITYHSPGARNLQITGKANCGKKQANRHQDGIQALGGTDITFAGFELGDYDAGYATCQGAGAGLFYSSADNVSPKNMKIVGGKYIACNRAVRDGNIRATGSIVNAKFRSHRNLNTTVPSVPGLCQDGSGGPYAQGQSDFDNPNVTQSGNVVQYWDKPTQSWVTSP